MNDSILSGLSHIEHQHTINANKGDISAAKAELNKHNAKTCRDYVKATAKIWYEFAVRMHEINESWRTV